LHPVRPGHGWSPVRAVRTRRASHASGPGARGQGLFRKAIRTYLHGRHIRATISERRGQRANRARSSAKGGRAPACDRVAYRRRNIVGRCFQRLNQFRAIATPNDKTALSYQAMIELATLTSGFEDAP
jgi:transposase